MSFSRCRMLYVVWAMMATLHPAAHAAGSPTEAGAQQIAQWIKELGADGFAVREKASKNLWQAGEAAEDALEHALQSGDAEIVRRAQAILDKFHWGIYPDTPADVVALIRVYQSAPQEVERRLTLENLLQSGWPGLLAVVKFAEMEKQPNQRKEMLARVSRKIPSAFQHVLMEDGDWQRFDAFITFAYEKNCIADNHYVAYALQRGQLDERIAQLRARLTHNPSERRLAVTLAYLYRTKGEAKEARAAAETAKRDDLVWNLLVEAAEWKTLTARPDAIVTKSVLEKWAWRVTLTRLAGEQRDFDNALGQLLQHAETQRDSFTTLSVARTLLLNDRVNEALALLAKSPDHQTELFELLCARRQYREALALADRSRPADSNEQQHLDLLKARTLFRLGEKEKAQALFVGYGARIKDGVNAFWAERLLAEEYQLGLKDLAFEHCTRIKASGIKVHWGHTSSSWGQSFFLRQLFPDRAESAKFWWELLRQKFPGDSMAATMKRLRDLLEGKTEARTVTQWIKAVRLPAGDPRWQALADAALANGLDDLAGSLLEKADTFPAQLRLGDLSAKKKQWDQAAARYRRAWRKSLTSTNPFAAEEPGDPLALYLAGEALRQQGRHKEGDRLIEQSHQVLLGDLERRYIFLKSLEERGYVQAARHEADLLARLSEPNSYYSGAGLRRLGRAAVNRKDYGKAAACYEQSTLRFLRPTAFYNEIVSYIDTPAFIHCLHAADLLAIGKHEEARRHIDAAMNLYPGYEEAAVRLVPEWERLGRKKEAEALLQRCLDPYEKGCRDYPRSAASHNSIAWINVCCRRNLDAALQHAEKAVALTPNNANNWDTLAEIHFQRGDKEKAVRAAKRALKCNPKKAYYRKQLKRIEVGDAHAERPPENEN